MQRGAQEIEHKRIECRIPLCYTRGLRNIPSRACWLAALSGALQVLCFPSPALDFLCWFAVAPLLLAILGPLARSGPQLVDAKGRPLGVLSGMQGFWLGYLIVAGVLFLVGGIAGLMAARFFRKGTPPTPQMAIEEAQLIKATLTAPHPATPEGPAGAVQAPNPAKVEARK